MSDFVCVFVVKIVLNGNRLKSVIPVTKRGSADNFNIYLGGILIW